MILKRFSAGNLTDTSTGASNGISTGIMFPQKAFSFALRAGLSVLTKSLPGTRQGRTKLAQSVVLLGVLGGLGGCGGLPGKKAPDADTTADTVQLTGDFSRSKLIAADFVATMAQLPEINPASTLLHTGKPVSRFGELFLSALQSAGFDLRIGNAQSSNWLTYNANKDKSVSSQGNPVYTFLVSAGDVRLKRSYEVDQYGVRPAGSMFVRGANTDSVVMDDSIFSVISPTRRPIASNTQTLDDNSESVLVSAVPKPETFVKTIKPVPQTTAKPMLQSTSDPIVSKRPAAVSNDNPFGAMSNMYETRESRYKELFASYDVIETDVFVFPNDSLIMGERNKKAVKLMAERFNPQTDIISVIGCSHGTSAIKNGNAFLANNRAFRVKEEFVAYGLGVTEVLEEGCWASVPFKEMPARGVLVRHKRVKS